MSGDRPLTVLQVRSDMIHLTKLDLRNLGDRVLEGTTVSARLSRGKASLWEATGPPGVALTIADVKWSNGERDVRAIKIECPLPQDLAGPRPLTRLERGGRLSVLQIRGQEYVELQVSRINPDSPEFWSSTHKATDEDFRHLAGDDWKRDLLAVGASKVGPRESVIGDDGRRRKFLCAVLEDRNSALPVVAYSLTRILPLLDLWSPVHAERTPLRNQRRVYVVELDDTAPGPESALGKVYVGETARSPEERFATHMAGARTASKRYVYPYGVRLLPALYEHIPPVGHADPKTAERLSEDIEKWLVTELKSIGYTSHGGTRGISEAFTQPDP